MVFKLHLHYTTKQRFAQDTRKIRAEKRTFLAGQWVTKKINTLKP